MEKPAQNIQDSFLNNARKEKLIITIYLLSGVKLSGRIRSFDKYCLVLETSNQEQLIFKHAISTVVMLRAAGREARENWTDRHAHAAPHAAAAAAPEAEPAAPAAAPAPATEASSA
jgi:host factor-I protein